MAVDFSLSQDQLAVAEAFGRFFENESPPSVVRGAEPLGADLELWRKLQRFGGPGMLADLDVGGGGAPLSVAIVVAEALGRHIAPVPLIEHWAASSVMATEAIVSGEKVATIALRPSRDGVWNLVPAGAVADIVIGIDGNETVAVEADPLTAAAANHASAPLADRATTTGERTVIGPARLLDAAVDRWRLLTAASLVGIADGALSLGVAYVLEREQFGRPIGTYQAIQHGMADFPGWIDGARFLAHKAAWAYDTGQSDDYVKLAAMAFIQATEAATKCTDRSLHYHGGYGFSLEYDIQLYFRRARGWPGVIGSLGDQRRRLADLMWPPAQGEST